MATKLEKTSAPRINRTDLTLRNLTAIRLRIETLESRLDARIDAVEARLLVQEGPAPKSTWSERFWGA